MKLTIATCQFAVSANIKRNCSTILRQMQSARRRGAQVAHFSETCLSGYAGSDFESHDGFDWELLKNSTEKIMELARKLHLWVIVGSAHRLTGKHKPHNCLYVINDKGKLVTRYDKTFCTGDTTEKSGDLKHYSPGAKLTTFDIKGIRCGTLICHDFRYSELYREYKRRGVQVMFHSYYNANRDPDTFKQQHNIWGAIVPPVTQAYAANNYMWISANNSSRRESCWPSFFTRPDGIILEKLKRNVAGMLISTVDTKAKFYDASRHWRDRAIRGVLHSGTLVSDKRSSSRTRL